MVSRSVASLIGMRRGNVTSEYKKRSLQLRDRSRTLSSEIFKPIILVKSFPVKTSFSPQLECKISYRKRRADSFSKIARASTSTVKRYKRYPTSSLAGIVWTKPTSLKLVGQLSVKLATKRL